MLSPGLPLASLVSFQGGEERQVSLITGHGCSPLAVDVALVPLADGGAYQVTDIQMLAFLSYP